MSSIKAQEEKIRNLLLPLVHRTVDKNHQSFPDLLKIMAAQPQWEHKLNNIEMFRVTRRRRYKSLLLQLKVIRCTGGLTRWLTVSWKKGTEKKRKEPNPLVSALRNAINGQSLTWGRSNWVGKCCAHCNGTNLLQVDHMDPQFALIRKEFIASFPDGYEFPDTFKPSKRGPRFLPINIGFTRKWQKYHRQQARYQWLCRDCNCKKLRKPTLRHAAGCDKFLKIETINVTDEKIENVKTTYKDW
jgi:hypothetical protein